MGGGKERGREDEEEEGKRWKGARVGWRERGKEGERQGRGRGRIRRKGGERGGHKTRE